MKIRKTIACIIARTNSNRLPGKVLKQVAGKTMLEHIIERVKRAKNIDGIYICTSTHPDDQCLDSIARKNEILFYSGSEDSVIERMLDVAQLENADNVVRITGDNIFTDSVYLDLMVQHHITNNAEYTRSENLPVGITAEVIAVPALKHCHASMDPAFSQYLMLYMFNPLNYKCTVLLPPSSHQLPEWTLTVDNPSDWERTELLFSKSVGFLDYGQIIELGRSFNIPYLKYVSDRMVKFPAGIIMNASAVRKELEERIRKSSTVKITENVYNGVLYDQSTI
jgi:spore coat polysaccharide biosynthesis protein SpsF